MAFPRTNCRTTTATVLTATATVMLSLRVCLCFSSQPLSQDDDGGCLPQCLLPPAARHGQPSVTCQDTICQDTFHKATLPGQALVRGMACDKKKRTSSVHGSLLGEIEEDTGGTVLRPSVKVEMCIAKRGSLCESRKLRKTVAPTADEGWLSNSGMWLVACSLGGRKLQFVVS